MKTVADHFRDFWPKDNIIVASQSEEKDKAIRMARRALRDPTVLSSDESAVLARQYLRALGISEHE